MFANNSGEFQDNGIILYKVAEDGVGNEILMEYPYLPLILACQIDLCKFFAYIFQKQGCRMPKSKEKLDVCVFTSLFDHLRPSIPLYRGQMGMITFIHASVILRIDLCKFLYQQILEKGLQKAKIQDEIWAPVFFHHFLAIRGHLKQPNDAKQT